MKKFSPLFSVGIVLLALSVCSAEGFPMKIYILAGQSNMVGLGKVTDSAYTQKKLMSDWRYLSYQSWVEARNSRGYGTTGVCFYYEGQHESYDGNGCWTTMTPNVWDGIKPGTGKNFGPELSFGYEMFVYHKPYIQPSFDDQKLIALIKYSHGNIKLNYDSSSHYSIPNNTFYPGDSLYSSIKEGYQFKQLVATVLDGCEQLKPDWEPEIAGMVWLQGVSDSFSDTDVAVYEDNLELLRNKLIHYFSAAGLLPNGKLPMVLGRISNFNKYAPESVTVDSEDDGRVVDIRTAQESFCNRYSDVTYVNTDSITRYKEADGYYSYLHYDAAGQVQLGKLCALAMKKVAPPWN